MAEDDINRFLGRLDARVTVLERQVAEGQAEIKAALQRISDKVDALGEQVAANRGGRQAIAWFVGICGAAAALIMSLPHLGSH